MKSSSRPITKLIVPLAGLGTRFTPSSTAYPKELAHLVDRPVLQYLMEEASSSGIKEVIFIINSNKSSVEKYFSKNFQDAYLKKASMTLSNAPKALRSLHQLIRDLDFKFIKKSSTLGDGHSVLCARNFIKDGESFAVTMGDLLGLGKTPFLKQLKDVFEKEGTSVISVERAPLGETKRFGVIGIRKSRGKIHEVSSIVEKPKPEAAPSRLVLTGKYVLTPEIFPILDGMVRKRKGDIKLSEALHIYAQTHKLLAYECRGGIQDAGNKLDFIKASISFGLDSKEYCVELKKFIKTLKI